MTPSTADRARAERPGFVADLLEALEGGRRTLTAEEAGALLARLAGLPGVALERQARERARLQARALVEVEEAFRSGAGSVRRACEVAAAGLARTGDEVPAETVRRWFSGTLRVNQ